MLPFAWSSVQCWVRRRGGSRKTTSKFDIDDEAADNQTDNDDNVIFKHNEGLRQEILLKTVTPMCKCAIQYTEPVVPVMHT